MFYLQYAARNFWRNRRWSLFAVFSIAAGVATIVALRSLGLSITDSLTSNLRAANHGDIRITLNGGFDFVFMTSGGEGSGFQPQVVDRLHTWTTEHGGQMTAYVTTAGLQITSPQGVSAGRPQFVATLFVEPETYPPSHTVVAQQPAGAALETLLTTPYDIVISENLADAQKIGVGDQVRVSGTEDLFTVRGIVSASYEAGLENLFASFFGFAYFRIDSMEALSLDRQPNAISLILPEALAPTTLEEAATLENELRDQMGDQSWALFTSVPELRQQNQTIADITSDLVVVMGLGAMLIGGVGIVNTMLVMVRRRTEEIAALKTFGLKARQVALLFMTEALLLGLVGSLLGAVLGVLLSGLANSYGETLIQQALVWRIYPEALLFGMVIGLIISGVFGVLPVLTAARVRPGIILRPNENHVPTSGILQSILALALVVISLGLIAGQIVGNYLFGVIGTAVVLVVLGVLICLLWVVVWLVGRLPDLGSVDLRLALRNLRSRRLRTATTLLALSAGMFALSSITFFGTGAREIAQITISGTLGGNVMIFSPLPRSISGSLIDNRLDQLDGVISRTRLENYSGEIVAVDGVRIAAEDATNERERLIREIDAAIEAGDFSRVEDLSEALGQYIPMSVQVMVRDTTGDNFSGDVTLAAGRLLTQEDRGQGVAIVPMLYADRAGATLGSTITLNANDKDYDFVVVGLSSDSGMMMSTSLIVPPGVMSSSGDIISMMNMTLAEVQPEHLDAALLSLSGMPLVFAIDIGFIDGLIQRFLDQFSALPILIGLLSLGAAAVIMANTVALATQERRRQIGILKAIGLKNRRVLGVLLLENVLVSLLGGLLGVGLSALGVLVVTSLGLDIAMLVPPDAVPTAIVLIVVAVLIGIAATLLSVQFALRERALNVLRYD